MAAAICPTCGAEIRYIVTAYSTNTANGGITPVEICEEELITERGRIVRGYRAHKCGDRNGGKNDKGENA